MTNTPSQDEIVDAFITAAWQNDTTVICDLAAQYPYLVSPSQPYLQDALHAACGSGQFNAAKLLVETFKADVNSVSGIGMTPLHEALNSADMEIARLLIDNGADVNARDQSRNGFTGGWTPLHYAVAQAVPEMVRHLLGRGADASARNNLGQTAAEMGRASKHKGRMLMAGLIDQLTGKSPSNPRHGSIQRRPPKP